LALGDELRQVSPPALEDGLHGRKPRIRAFALDLAPVDCQTIVLQLDKLCLVVGQEPESGLERRTNNELDWGESEGRLFHRRRQGRLLLDKGILAPPTLPEWAKFDWAQAKERSELDA
jgi:hypothetical protein